MSSGARPWTRPASVPGGRGRTAASAAVLIGLIQNNCMHRCASLFFGRNEENGVRCVYHGWKYDVTGQCVDIPNDLAGATYKAQIKATAYPCIEKNGFVWTYMGPRQTPCCRPIRRSSSPTGSSRSARWASNTRAGSSVPQWITASSA